MCVRVCVNFSARAHHAAIKKNFDLRLIIVLLVFLEYIVCVFHTVEQINFEKKTIPKKIYY